MKNCGLLAMIELFEEMVRRNLETDCESRELGRSPIGE